MRAALFSLASDSFSIVSPPQIGEHSLLFAFAAECGAVDKSVAQSVAIAGERPPQWKFVN